MIQILGMREVPRSVVVDATVGEWTLSISLLDPIDAAAIRAGVIQRAIAALTAQWSQANENAEPGDELVATWRATIEADLAGWEL